MAKNLQNGPVNHLRASNPDLMELACRSTVARTSNSFRNRSYNELPLYHSIYNNKLETPTVHTSDDPYVQSSPDDDELCNLKKVLCGLTKKESKCIAVVKIHPLNTANKLGSEDWCTMINIHLALLYEHLNFFQFIQRPALRKKVLSLTAERKILDCLWHNGLHSLLTLLLHGLPNSYDPMVAFLSTASDILELMSKTVPDFEDIWAEILGDLHRYRSAIARTIEARKTWNDIGESWFRKALEKAPHTGRLYHHISLLWMTLPQSYVKGIYLFSKSLMVGKPAPIKRITPMLTKHVFAPNLPCGWDPIDFVFVRVYVINFTGEHQELLIPSMNEYHRLLELQIKETNHWHQIGIPIVCTLIGYGVKDHFMMQLINPGVTPEEEDRTSNKVEFVRPTNELVAAFGTALSFMIKTYNIAITDRGRSHALPFVHTILTFMRHVSKYPAAMAHVAPSFPWRNTANMLNSLLEKRKERARVKTREVYRRGAIFELPEVLAMTNVFWADNDSEQSENNGTIPPFEAKFSELEVMSAREDQIISCGHDLVRFSGYMTWDEKSEQFAAIRQCLYKL